jgi:coronin-1B/1C/6
VPLDKPGRWPVIPYFSGHSGALLDFDFNPFHDNIIASGSEDNTVKVWGIPEGGLKSNVSDPLVDLIGHNRKVVLIKFHPTANNVLASASADFSVKLWDIERGAEVNSHQINESLIQELVWDYTGSQYAISTKDKSITTVDARSATTATVIENAHDGVKSIKLTYLGAGNNLLSVGFNKQSQRQIKIWDPRNSSVELNRFDIDQAAGVLMPFYDPDTSLVFLTGKGDGNIRYFESVHQELFPLSEYRTSVATKGAAMVPKRGLKVMNCEIARFMKLTVNSVEPVSFIVPRKSEQFQEDLYPDSAGSIPSHTLTEWLGGSELPPILTSLNPVQKSSSTNSLKQPGSPHFVAPKTVAVLSKELEEANLRIKKLEEKLAAAGISIN